MHYTREFIPLKECTSGYGRGGMIPHGIARIERQKEIRKIRINLYGLAPGPGPYEVYAIRVEGRFYWKDRIGIMQPDPLGRCELDHREMEEGTQEIRVIIIAVSDGTEVLTGYVNGSIDWKKMINADTAAAEDEAREEKDCIPDEITEEIQEEVQEEVTEEKDPAMELSRYVQIPEEEAAPITSEAAARDALQYMMQVYPRLYPFRESQVRWIRIHPRDIAPLPTDVVTLESSPFLQRGYLQYKHLILGYDETAYYLGVPFRYQQDQEEIAHNWGFTEFRNSYGTVPMKGDYGYWIRSITWPK